MIKRQSGWSLLDDPHNGYAYMAGLVKLSTPDKSLLMGNDEWNRNRVLEHLNKKKRFLEVLMFAMFIVGGKPVGGAELGSIKFRDSVLTRRNFFTIGRHMSLNIIKQERVPIIPILSSDIFLLKSLVSCRYT